MSTSEHQNIGSSKSESFVPYEFVEDGKVIKVLGTIQVKRSEDILAVVEKEDKADELLKELQTRAKEQAKKQITPVKPGSTVDYKLPDESWHSAQRS